MPLLAICRACLRAPRRAALLRMLKHAMLDATPRYAPLRRRHHLSRRRRAATPDDIIIITIVDHDIVTSYVFHADAAARHIDDYYRLSIDYAIHYFD